MDQLLERIATLEAAQNDRNRHIQEVAAAAGQAAAQAANAGGHHHQPAVDGEGNPIDHRAEKRYDIACKSLSSAPKFYGRGSWRTFESSYETWYRVNHIDRQNQEFQKRSLLACMRGQAVEMTRPYNEGSQTWTNCVAFAAYLDAFRRIFLPPEESELARTEFKVRKQGRKEGISSYLSAKIALWQLAYPEAERSFSTLMDEIIAGTANRVVKRRLRYAEIANVPELRRQAVRMVAAERQCYREGTSESTSMDGLAATTHIKNEQYSDDEMDVDEEGMNAMGRFEGNCRKCGTYGHKASDCRKSKTKTGSDAKDQRKCYTCDRTGHMKKDCHAKTKANGDKIVRSTDKKKSFGKDKKPFKGKSGVKTQAEADDDEDEEDEDDFLGEEGDSEEEK